MSSNSYHIYPAGDHALTIEFGKVISGELNDRVIALWKQLQANPVPTTIDLLPAYSSLTLVYDLRQVYTHQPATSAFDWVANQVEKHIEQTAAYKQVPSRLVTIPVCYDVSLAPDLQELAKAHQLTTADVVKIHTSRTYRVYLVGFLPGFPYMGKVDERIITPRRQQPRTLVTAGSVGIAGEQTGIYPLASPGGWQIIGRTPVQLFEPAQQSPSFLKPGDEVEFTAISLSEFNSITA